jgi:hypothetical protein
MLGGFRVRDLANGKAATQRDRRIDDVGDGKVRARFPFSGEELAVGVSRDFQKERCEFVPKAAEHGRDPVRGELWEELLLVEVEQVWRGWLGGDEYRNNSAFVGGLVEVVQKESVFLDLLLRLAASFARLCFENDDCVADEEDYVDAKFLLWDGEFENQTPGTGCIGCGGALHQCGSEGAEVTLPG